MKNHVLTFIKNLIYELERVVALHKFLTPIEFRHIKVAYEVENSLFGGASCTACKAGLMFLNYYLHSGVTLEQVIRDTNMMCSTFRYFFSKNWNKSLKIGYLGYNKK